MDDKLIKYYQAERKNALVEAILFYGNDSYENRDLIALYNRLEVEQPTMELVWVENDNAPENAKIVSRGEEAYYYYLARARFIVADCHIDQDYLKRKTQRYLQIRALELNNIGLEQDSSEQIAEQRLQIVKNLEDARRWSYMAVSSNEIYETFHEAYALKEKRILAGRPAFDYIFAAETNREILKRKNQDVILVDFKDKSLYDIITENESQYQVIDLNAPNEDYSKNELKLMSDIYITDHLENTVEIANFNRPMIYLESGNAMNLRYTVEEFFPGKIIASQSDLIEELTNINSEEYLAGISAFNERFNLNSGPDSASEIIDSAKMCPCIKKPKANFFARLYKKIRKKVLKKYNSFVWKILYKKAQKKEIENKTVLFESFLGRNYSDNPKAIYEYMQQNHPDYTYVIALNNPSSAKGEVPGNAKLVRRFGARYVYYLARAKFIVSNSRMTLKYQKRDGQVYIQTWHGTPLKKLVMDQKNVNLPGTNKQNYIINFLNEAKRWDYLISANAHSTKVFNSAFLQENIIETGYPRNDILVNASSEYISELKASFNLNQDDKVLLYAPTFRDDEYVSKGNYTQKIELDLAEIQAKLPEWKIFLRTHYLVTENMDLSFDNVVNVSDYHDINHLYLIADSLMTDYSSVFFDYAILDRPMMFFAYDLEKYESDLRGFYFDYESTIPGKNIQGTDDLIDILSNLEKYENDYQAKRQDFRNEFSNLEIGTASKQIADLIVNHQ